MLQFLITAWQLLYYFPKLGLPDGVKRLRFCFFITPNNHHKKLEENKGLVEFVSDYNLSA